MAHEPVVRATSATAERALVAVFASPVAGYLLRYGADMGFRGLLLEPDEARAAGAAALGFPLLTAIPDDLDDSADVVVTDHHRAELGVMLRDALATKARWVGIMGNPHHVGPRVGMLTELGVSAEEIARVHRPIGLNIGSGSRPRSPSPRWPACWLTVTAGPGDLNSYPEIFPAGHTWRMPGLHPACPSS